MVKGINNESRKAKEAAVTGITDLHEEQHQLGNHRGGKTLGCPICFEDLQSDVDAARVTADAANEANESAEEELDSLRAALLDARSKLKTAHTFNALLQETLMRILQLTDPQRNRN